MKFMNLFNTQDDRDIAAQIKAATNIKMDEASQERMRANLFEYTKMRPIRRVEPALVITVVNRFSTFLTRHSMSAIAALLIVAVSGGTVAAAETALPGDVLYPVKVHVTEEVRASLAVSPKAKADWAMNRAERRLEEAATLALAGNLSDETRAEINTNLDTHIESAGKNRQQLEDENDSVDASEVEKNIGAVRIARANILDGKRGKPRAAKALARIEVATDTTTTMMSASLDLQATVQKDDDEPDEPETKTRGERTAAKVRIEASKKFLNRPNRLGTTTEERARERLQAATKAFSSGDDDNARGNKENASSNFNSALEAATEIETLIFDSHDSDKNDSEDKKDDSKDENSGENENRGSGSED